MMGDTPSSRTFTQEARRWSPGVLGGDGDKGLDPGQPSPGPQPLPNPCTPGGVHGGEVIPTG